MVKWVVYHTGWSNGEFDSTTEVSWDRYVKTTPDTKCVEVARGLTAQQASCMARLANEGLKEKEDGNEI
jgi:hypothetical protein